MTSATASKPMLTLRFDLPPSMNREGSHWRHKQRLHHAWKQDAYEKWLEAGRPKMAACSIRPIFVFPDNRRRDTHNFLGGTALKGLLDGLTGNLVSDDNHLMLKLLEPVIRKGPAEMILEIEEGKVDG